MKNDFKLSVNSKESKYGTLLTILLVIVILIILGLLAFWAYDVYKKNDIQTDTAEAIEEFEKNINTNNYEEDEEEGHGNITIGSISNPYSTGQNTTGNNGTTGVQTYKGFVVVGRIEIPKTNVNLPVLEKETAQSLEASVAVRYGPGLNQVGNTVIVGHNYRNGLFFSNNAKIAVGDKIYITDTSGKKLTYIVYSTYVTSPEDTEYMMRDTQGGREISLSTCTDDSSGRIIICAKAE